MKTVTRELKVGEWTTTFFAVRSVERRTSRNNRDSMVIDMGDSSGSIRGYLWNALKMGAKIKPHSIVKVTGYVKSFNGINIIQIKQIRPVSKAEIDLNDFVPHTGHGSEKELKEREDRFWPGETGDLFGNWQK